MLCLTTSDLQHREFLRHLHATGRVETWAEKKITTYVCLDMNNRPYRPMFKAHVCVQCDCTEPLYGHNNKCTPAGTKEWIPVPRGDL